MRIEHVDFTTSDLSFPDMVSPDSTSSRRPPEVARVNGVALHALSQVLTPEELRQRACTELLRQAAQRAGLLDAADVCLADAATSEAATAAIESLLEQSLVVPDPSEADCRRYFAARESAYCSDERVHARHILFAVTPGVDVVALRRRAEMTMLEVRCFDGSASPGFESVAARMSNCPSGAAGGDLGWLTRADCAPEFAREVFGHAEVGVLPRLVHSRFGLHVIEVLAREPGTPQPFEAVRGAAELALRQQTYVAALRQFLQVLAARALVEGVDLGVATSPLVQ